MRKLGLILGALAIVAFGVATSQAGLISLYEFEDGALSTTAANSVAGQQDGTLIGNASLADGKIGDGGYLSSGGKDAANGVDVTGTTAFAYEPFTSRDNAFWAGSWSTWVRWDWTDQENNSFSVAYYQDTGSSFRSSYIQRNDAFSFLPKENVRKNGTYVYQDAGTVLAVLPTQDGQWHHMAYTWTLTEGASGTGSGAFYIDGVLVREVSDFGTATSDLSTGAITAAAVFAIGTNGSGCWPGAGDDFGVWNTVLNDAEVAALANLGNDEDLNYGAKLAEQLFDLYAAGGRDRIGGQLWMNVDGGLGDVAGAIVDLGGGFKGLNLGGENGAGLIVPEPGTMSLLAVAFGLLVFAWKKRK